MKEPDAVRAAVSCAVFERILHQALDSPEISAAIGRADKALTRERLGAEARAARASIARTVSAEYDHYLRVRLSAGGLVPLLVLLVSSLGAAAAGVYVLCGFDLRALDVRPHLNDALLTAGVIAAVVTAGAALGDVVWMVATRNRPVPDDEAPGDPDSEVTRAHDAWQRALLERGVMPFLLARLDGSHAGDPGGAQPQPSGAAHSLSKERPSQSDWFVTPGRTKK